MASLVACNKAPAPKAERVPEAYTATANAVKFDILPVGSSEFDHAWEASYIDGERSTRFRLELNRHSGKGQFTSEPGSDPTVLLNALQTALAAKHVPRNVTHVDSLPFTFVVLGEHQKRATDGSFSPDNDGHWTTMRISVGKGEAFLNLNPVDAVAEFSREDLKYGDAVVSELAKVL